VEFEFPGRRGLQIGLPVVGLAQSAQSQFTQRFPWLVHDYQFKPLLTDLYIPTEWRHQRSAAHSVSFMTFFGETIQHNSFFQQARMISFWHFQCSLLASMKIQICYCFKLLTCSTGWQTGPSEKWFRYKGISISNVFCHVPFLQMDNRVQLPIFSLSGCNQLTSNPCMNRTSPSLHFKAVHSKTGIFIIRLGKQLGIGHWVSICIIFLPLSSLWGVFISGYSLIQVNFLLHFSNCTHNLGFVVGFYSLEDVWIIEKASSISEKKLQFATKTSFGLPSLPRLTGG
jgi:hypothetical protein